MKDKKKTIKFKSKPVLFDAKEGQSSRTAVMDSRDIPPKTNKKIESINKECTFLDYMSDNSGRLFPEKDSWRERLVHTMLEWSQDKDALEIDQFCIEYKIPRTTLYLWRDKYPDVKKIIDEVKLIIASRRRVFSMTRKIDGHYAYRNLHQYDPEHISVDKYHASLKRDESGEKEKIGVVLPCYNSCCAKDK
jgi:hypothetical protein